MSQSKDMLSPYEKLKEHLIKIGEHKKFVEIFIKNRTAAEKFSEIWSRSDLLQVIPLGKPSPRYNPKDDYLAEKFLLNGNRLCKECKLSKALLSYNFGVLTASYPEENTSQKDEKQERTIDPLVTAFATRSALLFDMKRYSDSIKDIDRAIKHGYPHEKIEKLEQRRIKCLLNMNNYKEAVKMTKELIEKAKSNNETDSVSQLETLLKQCKTKSEEAKSDSILSSAITLDLFQRGSEIPLFLKKYNKEKDINYVSQNVKVSYCLEKGRHLVAVRDIEPGEVLMVEKAICSIPRFNDKLRFYCCVCMRRAPIPVPCENCSLVCFCSDECFMSKHNNHRVECPILPYFLCMYIDEELGLVIRTLLKYTMEEILSELEHVKNSKSLSNFKEAKAFLQSPVTYLTVTKLEGNHNQRSGNSMLESIANAIVGVQLLQLVPSFWERANKDDPPVEQNFEILTILGGELTKLLLNFQCNIHCLKELHLDTESNILALESYDAGYGVFKSFSLMNHSCAPNCLHSSWGDVKYLYSIDFIPKGEEIVDSYGERYASHALEVRKNNLEAIYYFDCQCQACINNWPLFAELPKAYEFVCPACRTLVDQVTLKCTSCKTLEDREDINARGSDANSAIADLKEIRKEIKTASEIYDTCFKELNDYQTSFENIKKIGKYIKLLSKYTNVPHMPFIEAQEAMLRNFDLMGALCCKGYSNFD